MDLKNDLSEIDSSRNDLSKIDRGLGSDLYLRKTKVFEDGS
jgi:hypothetical protein